MDTAPAGRSDSRGCTADPSDAVRAIRWTCVALLAAIAIGVFVNRVRNTEQQAPYTGQIYDEPFIVYPATRMALTGDLHPWRFGYPSVPKYLTATSIGVATLFGADTPRELRRLHRWANDRGDYWFYDSRAMAYATCLLYTSDAADER